MSTKSISAPQPFADGAASLSVSAERGGATGASARIAALMLVSDTVLIGIAALLLWATAGLPPEGAIAFLTVSLAAIALGSHYATALRPAPTHLDELRRLGGAILVSLAAALFACGLAGGLVMDRRLAASAIVAVAAIVIAITESRRAIRRVVGLRHPERVLIIGAGATGQELARRMARDRSRAQRVVGFVDADPCQLASDISGIPVHPGTDGIGATLRETAPDRIVIAFSRRPAALVLDDLRTAGAHAVPISVVPQYHELTPPHAQIAQVDGMPLVQIQSARLSRGARLVKRTLDLTLASLGIVALAPLFAATAILIKTTSRGPVFFRQERTGRDGREFTMWKFRTMSDGAEGRRFELADHNEMAASGPLFKIRRDPRVTRLGRVLRRLSIDELPQLINVMNGTMSLVGPRPFVVHEAEQMGGWARHRLDLSPGITGLWQVRGRNDIPYEEMVRLDYMYVANWSPLWDLRILLETIPQVLRGRGAS